MAKSDMFVAQVLNGLSQGLFQGLQVRDQRSQQLQEMKLKERSLELQQQQFLSQQEFREKQLEQDERATTAKIEEARATGEFTRAIKGRELGLKETKEDRITEKSEKTETRQTVKLISELSQKETQALEELTELQRRLKINQRNPDRRAEIEGKIRAKQKQVVTLQNQMRELQKDEAVIQSPQARPTGPQPEVVSQAQGLISGAETIEDVIAATEQIQVTDPAVREQIKQLAKDRIRLIQGRVQEVVPEFTGSQRPVQGQQPVSTLR